MSIDFRGPGKNAPRSERWLHFAVGVLNLVLIGMLLYLRLGPFARFLRNLAERGAEAPPWLSMGFTGGTVVFIVFLGVRAWASFRRFRESG